MKTKLIDTFDGYFVSDYGNIGLKAKLDYFVNTGFWFGAILSITGEDTGTFMAVVGWFRGSQFSYRETKKDYHLNRETLAKYEKLKAADSLWLLIDESEFWSDTVSFERVYWKSGPKANPNWGVSAITIRELERTRSHIFSGPKTHSGWMAYMAAITNHVFDSTLIDFPTSSVPTRSVDFAVHQEEWFFEFLSVTYESNFAWSAIVGQHLGDSLIYRFVSEPLNPLDPDKISEYKSAARAGDIFTLTGKTLIPDQVASYQQLWHDAAATSETRVWKIGSD